MNPPKASLTPIERALLLVDAPGIDTLWRAAVGYLLLPLHAFVTGTLHLGMSLTPWLLLTLLAMRVGPAVLRKLLPFPAGARTAWEVRRALGKEFDSYQWRKLAGFGAGWLTYLVLHQQTQGRVFVSALVCLVAGIAGWFFWLRASHRSA